MYHYKTLTLSSIINIHYSSRAIHADLHKTQGFTSHHGIELRGVAVLRHPSPGTRRAQTLAAYLSPRECCPTSTPRRTTPTPRRAETREPAVLHQDKAPDAATPYGGHNRAAPRDQHLQRPGEAAPVGAPRADRRD